MKIVFSRLLGFLKYLLLLVSFALIFYGIIMTYKRLDKDMAEAIPVFIPFVLVLIVFIINLFIKSNVIRNNLFYNVIAVLVFATIIVIGLRAKFDSNMMLYHKYAINYNPAYLADNLSIIQMMLYTLCGSNILLMLSTLFDKKKKVVEKQEEKKVEKEKKVKDEK